MSYLPLSFIGLGVVVLAWTVMDWVAGGTFARRTFQYGVEEVDGLREPWRFRFVIVSHAVVGAGLIAIGVYLLVVGG